MIHTVAKYPFCIRKKHARFAEKDELYKMPHKNTQHRTSILNKIANK